MRNDANGMMVGAILEVDVDVPGDDDKMAIDELGKKNPCQCTTCSQQAGRRCTDAPRGPPRSWSEGCAAGSRKDDPHARRRHELFGHL